MTLLDILQFVRRRWIVIAAGALIGLTVGTVLAALQRPTFSATSAIYVSSTSTSSITDAANGAAFANNIVQSYQLIAVSPLVLERVRRELGLPAAAADIAAASDVQIPPATSVLRITVTWRDPAVAADIANGIAGEMKALSSSITPARGTGSLVRVTEIQTARANRTPTTPGSILVGGVGVGLGLLLGLTAAAAVERLDSRLRRISTTLLGRPVIGNVPRVDSLGRSPLIADTAPASRAAEAFRVLRLAVDFLDIDNPRHSYVVTSAEPGEGKSTVAVNLAVTFKHAGRSVVIVDGDLRRPTVAKLFGLEGTVGLTDVLRGGANLDDAIQTWGDGGVAVLPAGLLPPNPADLVDTQRMDELLAELEARYEIVLIDTPPVLVGADASILASKAVGALFVASLGRTHLPRLARAFHDFQLGDARALGIVMNRVPERQSAYSYYSAEPNAPDDAFPRSSPAPPRVGEARWRPKLD